MKESLATHESTYSASLGTKIFLYFRQVSALEHVRFKQILLYIPLVVLLLSRPYNFH